jgi:hypothetical protein
MELWIGRFVAKRLFEYGNSSEFIALINLYYLGFAVHNELNYWNIFEFIYICIMNECIFYVTVIYTE